MKGKMFELNTSVFTLKELKNTDISSYDAIYLGDPFCRQYKDNLSENCKDLKTAIRIVKDKGKKVFVSTYAVPRNADLKGVEKTLFSAAKSGADAVEIQNYGVLRISRREFPELPVHIGSLANIYTVATALKLKEDGVKRIKGNYELCLDELAKLNNSAGLETEVLLHGKMILGISEECLTKKWSNKKTKACQDFCRRNNYLSSKKLVLNNFGRVTLSGKDMCTIEHLPLILDKGFRFFRIESFRESRDYAAQVGNIYRNAIIEALESRKYSFKKYLLGLKNFSPIGFCNGYYFARSGQDYIHSKK